VRQLFRGRKHEFSGPPSRRRRRIAPYSLLALRGG
jgi:hypothetical protein